MGFSRSYLLVAIFFTLLAFSCCQAMAQQRCEPSDLFITPLFQDTPEHTFTLAIEARNISSHTCIVNPPSTLGYDPLGFDPPNGAPVQAPFKTHAAFNNTWDAADRGELHFIALQPGEIASFSYKWNTVSPDGPDRSERCFTPRTIQASSIMLQSPDLFPPICSDIEVSPYQSGPFPTPKSNEQTLQLSAPDHPIYRHERFYLTAKSSSSFLPPQHPSGGMPAPLKDIYLFSREPNGRTVVRPASPWYFQCCRPGAMSLHFDASSSSVSFELRNLEDEGDYQFQILTLPPKALAEGRAMRFKTSNILHLQALDPAHATYTWGPSFKGIAIGINLDKTEFVTGEEIPVHLAVENFEADTSVHAVEHVSDPWFYAGLQVFDSDGKEIQGTDSDPRRSLALGMPWGNTFEFPRGKLVGIERSLYPLKPGAYTIIATWAPKFGSETEYSIVEAHTSFRVLPAPTK